MSRTNQKTIENLQSVLGQTFKLYFQTQSYHWNVEGPQFRQLHETFEEQYTDLSEALDGIAERIRALGAYGPRSIAEMLSYSKGETPEARTADEMVANTVSAHRAIAETLRKAIQAAADEGDDVSAGMFTDRLEIHEKTLWMMKASQK